MIIRTEHDLQQALLLDSETEHVEFKEAKNRYDFEELVGYCCALANEGGGSIVLGVTDKLPRRIEPKSACSTGCICGSNSSKSRRRRAASCQSWSRHARPGAP